MNNLNQLEKRLESWIPRRPSARLKEQIFAIAETPKAIVIPLWLKLAPALCIVLTIAFFSMPRHEQVSYLAASGSSNMLACLSSNLLSYCATDVAGGRENLWSGATFDWTKDGVSLSTTRSFPAGKTNIQKL